MRAAADHRPVRSPRVRAAVQAACFGGFVYLALAVGFGWSSPLPHDLFLRFDPLVWAVTSAAARQPAAHGVFVAALVIATALVGRAFCGWVCPLGTAIDMAGAAAGRRGGRRLPAGLCVVRFWLLAALLASAAAGVSLAGWFDPLLIASRALHLARAAARGEAAGLVAWAMAAAAVGLALWAPRFWCRALCPLGAVLSLAARRAPYRRLVANRCIGCGACGSACPMGQTPLASSPGECIGCRRCEAACGQGAVGFALGGGPVGGPGQSGLPPPDHRRRALVFGLTALTAGAAAGLAIGRRPQTRPLRPPGAADERRFTARCVGCGSCVAVCPTCGLAPLVQPARLDAVFTPVLVPRVGPCLPDCTACGDVCPTGAIAPIATEQKRGVRIGLAVIDPARCLPWAHGQRCVICREACPAEYGAIELRPIGPGRFGPWVRGSLCTGCGICEHQCPLEGEAAIQVVAAEPPADAAGGPAGAEQSRSESWGS